MSHKGSWSRVKDTKAWDECPLWKNKEKKKENEAINTDPDHSQQGETSQTTKRKTSKADRQSAS